MGILSFKYVVVLLFIYLLVVDIDVDAWRRRRKRPLRKRIKDGLKKIGQKIKSGVKKIGQKIKKNACKWFYGIACPAAVGIAGAAITGSTGAIGGAAAAVGGAVVTRACRVQRKKCRNNRGRREANSTVHEILVPFSDELRDYDLNEDKCVSYEEFVFAVLRSVPLENPYFLQEPFDASDLDGDGVLSSDEFKSAPLLFAHAFNKTLDGFIDITDDLVTTTDLPGASMRDTGIAITSPTYDTQKAPDGFPRSVYKAVLSMLKPALVAETSEKPAPAA